MVAAAATAVAAALAGAQAPTCANAQLYEYAKAVAGKPRAVSRRVGCIPAGHTVSHVRFSWGDWSASRGRVTLMDEVPDVRTAIFSARHTYARRRTYPVVITWIDDQTGEPGRNASLSVRVSGKARHPCHHGS